MINLNRRSLILINIHLILSNKFLNIIIILNIYFLFIKKKLTFIEIHYFDRILVLVNKSRSYYNLMFCNKLKFELNKFFSLCSNKKKPVKLFLSAQIQIFYLLSKFDIFQVISISILKNQLFYLLIWYPLSQWRPLRNQRQFSKSFQNAASHLKKRYVETIPYNLISC